MKTVIQEFKKECPCCLKEVQKINILHDKNQHYACDACQRDFESCPFCDRDLLEFGKDYFNDIDVNDVNDVNDIINNNNNSNNSETISNDYDDDDDINNMGSLFDDILSDGNTTSITSTTSTTSTVTNTTNTTNITGYNDEEYNYLYEYGFLHC